jgi:ceramide glucosyltransferase
MDTLLSLVVWGIGVGLMFFGTHLMVSAEKKKSRRFQKDLILPAYRPAISILKPLKGADNGLKENLESFFQLHYKEFEIIFSVAEVFDPAIQVVEELQSQYPTVTSTLIIGDILAGPNPKVNNMIRGYENAKHDWILIADSNVRVPKDYLLRISDQLEDSIGVMTAVVSGRAAEQTGGHLEAVFLNTYIARWMRLAAFFGRPCVVGKSMIFRRSVAEGFGGIRSLARYLAEDYMTGEKMAELGYEVRVQDEPIPQQIGKYSLQSFWSRHIRWGRIRKSQAPIAFILEPISNSIVSGLIGSYAFHSQLGVSLAAFWFFHLTFWAWGDWRVMRAVGADSNNKVPFVWFLRELLHLPLWIHISLGNTVTWRGRRLTLQRGGILKETS